MANVPFYSYSDILAKIKLGGLVDFMRQSIRETEIANVVIPEKSLIHLDKPNAIFISMPALSQKLGYYINKVGTFFERVSGDHLPSIHAVVALFSSQNGEIKALLDGQAVTNLKCAAITAVVTDHCAKPDATKLAIIGAGTQARQQLYGICQVRNIRELYLYNRSKSRLAEFINEIKKNFPHLKIYECDTIAKCISKAEIIGTTTSSSTPIADFDNINQGVHINCMGLHTSESREIPNNVLANVKLIVEDVPTAIREAGEIHSNALDIFKMVNTDSHVLQIEQTIFSSTGFALLDLITSVYITQQLSDI